MEETQIVLERHEQRLKTLERDISDLKAVQIEIRTMNEALVTLATELKHTNEHLARHEQKIDAIEGQPRMRMQQIVTAIIAALAGGLISAVIGVILA
jgi:septal ring factor EnvC (AmiA/AmiB activator)